MTEIQVFDKPELITTIVNTIMEYAVTSKSTILDYGIEEGGEVEEVEENKQESVAP